MKSTEKAFEKLWDNSDKQYYSRDFITHKLLKESSVATLLPLYGGSITHKRAAELVKLVENDQAFALLSHCPLPLSVPNGSSRCAIGRAQPG